jgi:hypothetical protein
LRVLAFDEAREDMRMIRFCLMLTGVCLLLRKRKPESDLMQPWIRAYPERIDHAR